MQKKEKKFDFESDISIDRDNLDEELIKQPGLYFKYAKEAEDLQVELKDLQRELAVVDAKIDSEIRKDISNGKEGKLTEKAIAAKILLDQDHQEIETEIAEKEYNLRVIRSAGVGAIEHKKSSLKHLTELYIAGYWSSVKTATASEIKKKHYDKADDKIVKDLNNKKPKRGK